jgi:hypothetical protein
VAFAIFDCWAALFTEILNNNKDAIAKATPVKIALFLFVVIIYTSQLLLAIV